MPMDFPDMESLKRAAQCHHFRQPKHGESEVEFRLALADHVEAIDFIEGQEIRNKVGWDKWTETQRMNMLRRRMQS